MDMSSGMIRGLGTLVVFVAFIGLALWVFNAKRTSEFAEACMLPFADDEPLPAPPEDSTVTRSTRP
ncbi:CcoQ/FixQ family Cbb3-type cytochrome c oxidase assembly chaperone [Pseudomonas gingeri]|uniref:CcoQ/FixQ family Cbb3-type cytochrome c oxidase assembly chaperone n=1 Tax=Pseudomonas gingeri TaxID=117681 RepID=A0A7Y7XIF4_9PSED|nr:cbb3-type cytochrome c oxidase subunit 3 [Pseudomonas gingeri]NWA27882.1 CcoQ/FixQ family Cbb3-type cytochrome c oxidase assembly chaperone [Pseudomonas gingeri]NWC00117.1 CcoQ/FixQ family Cbb3-type cytochrome c oxidase assembly chaperone [Pseudomonas gingeri]NWD69951.1 CcoQ/FixQ family Cbb3-type cytochrome c oxidase assembly chaperone [Pseudomonas gingeri]